MPVKTFLPLVLCTWLVKKKLKTIVGIQEKKTILNSLLKCVEMFSGPYYTNSAFACSEGYLGTIYYKSLDL